MHKRFISIVIALIFIVVNLFCLIEYQSFPVKASTIDEIPDPGLRQLIRETLNRPYGDITLTDLGFIRKLDGQGRAITDITGVEFLVNLSEIDLSFNSISDLTPLGTLYANTDGEKLRTIRLSYNNISDISPLATMIRLETLDLTANQISDVTPFYKEYGLYGVKWLGLAGNQIKDISGLRNLRELTFLALDQNQIEDISPLVENLGLGLGDTIYLQGNPLNAESSQDLIQQLRDKRVSVYWSPPYEPEAEPETPDIAEESVPHPVTFPDSELEKAIRSTLEQPAEVLTTADTANITELNAPGMGITSLEGIESLSALETLDVSQNSIQDLKPLYYLKNLSDLNLSNNQISSIWYVFENQGIGSQDTIDLRGNHLSQQSLDLYIPQLQERGVTILYDTPPPDPTTPPPPPEIIYEYVPSPAEPDSNQLAAPLQGLIGGLGGAFLGLVAAFGIRTLWKLSRAKKKT